MADDATIQKHARTLVMSSVCLSLVQELVLLYKPAVGALRHVISTNPALCNLACRVVDHLLFLTPSSKSFVV